MSFFSKLKSAVTAPADVTHQSAPILPPDAPASEPALAAKPVEGHADVRVFPKEEVVKVAVDPRLPNVEEAPAPKRRGRPPGSKNRMKFVDAPDDAPAEPPIGATPVEPSLVTVASKVTDTKSGVVAPKSEPAREGAGVEVRFKSVTVTKGATINLGNYNSARFESTVTVECADYDAGYAAALQKVDAALEAEVARMQAAKT